MTHWTRHLPEAGNVTRHADEIERMKNEIQGKRDAIIAIERDIQSLNDAIRTSEQKAVADATQLWSLEEIHDAKRSARYT